MKGCRELAGELCILEGAVTTGVIVAGKRALLFDCCDSVTAERLAELGVEDRVAIAAHLVFRYSFWVSRSPSVISSNSGSIFTR